MDGTLPYISGRFDDMDRASLAKLAAKLKYVSLEQLYCVAGLQCSTVRI